MVYMTYGASNHQPHNNNNNAEYSLFLCGNFIFCAIFLFHRTHTHSFFSFSKLNVFYVFLNAFNFLLYKVYCRHCWCCSYFFGLNFLRIFSLFLVLFSSFVQPGKCEGKKIPIFPQFSDDFCMSTLNCDKKKERHLGHKKRKWWLLRRLSQIIALPTHNVFCSVLMTTTTSTVKI